MKDIEVLKKNGIDVDRSLELLGDLDTYDEMLESFLEESEVRLPRMKDAKNKRKSRFSKLCNRCSCYEK